MAFISKKCIECNDPTKRVSGSYRGKDRQGAFKGDMYTCENKICEIYRARDREVRRLTVEPKPEREEVAAEQPKKNGANAKKRRR